MTEPDSTFEEEVRRALCAAGDLVVPAGDGLTKIRARARRRPHALAWFLAYATHLPGRLFTWLRVAGSEASATAHGHSSLGPAARSARHWPQRALRTPSLWIRPVLAAVAALAIVISATLAVPRLRGAVGATLADLTSGSSQGHNGVNNPGGGAAQSRRAHALSTGVKRTPGQPVDATLPASASSRCRSQGSKSASDGTGAGSEQVPAPLLGPVGSSASGSQTATCPGTASSRAAATSAPAPPTPTPAGSSTPTSPSITPPSTPTTTPPTTPTTTPPTSPTTTPPTSPTTTPPTTPTGTPSTTTSPDGSASPASPTGTAAPD